MPFHSLIQQTNLEAIAFKVALEEGWPLDKVDSVEYRYRCFLQAILNDPTRQMVPDKDTDLFWHHHILDTRKYMNDCQRIFGRYIHHFPYSGLQNDEAAKAQHEHFLRSQEVMEAIVTSP